MKSSASAEATENDETEIQTMEDADATSPAPSSRHDPSSRDATAGKQASILIYLPRIQHTLYTYNDDKHKAGCQKSPTGLSLLAAL